MGSRRPDTVLAVAYDLKVSLTVMVGGDRGTVGVASGIS
jgi:hypothetical protein